MPYIEAGRRKRFDSFIDGIVESLDCSDSHMESGDLNYCISRIVWGLWERDHHYAAGNNLVGVLECVKQEFYRRMLGPYEDEKRARNGDIV
jgi:hypothetical protein